MANSIFDELFDALEGLAAHHRREASRTPDDRAKDASLRAQQRVETLQQELKNLQHERENNILPFTPLERGGRDQEAPGRDQEPSDHLER